jgi:hypothetical protein
VGKSFLAAESACEWIDTHDIGEAFVVSTAPTSPQVSAILWRNIEIMHRKAGLPGHIAMGRIPEWKVGKELIGYGRKPSDYDENGFQGIHAPYLLVIVDEADGIPKQLWDAVDSLATNVNARVLAIGNPNDPMSHFKTICMPGSGWNVIHLDGLLSPNFSEYEVKAASNKTLEEGLTGDLYAYMVENNIPFATERVPYELQRDLLSPLWVAERMPRWGIYRLDDGTWTTAQLWEAKVRGRFSDMSTDGTIPMAWVMKAVERWKEWQASGLPVEKLTGGRVWGVDCAGEGSDETCVAERVGYTCISVERNGWGTDTQTPAKVLSARADAYGRGRFVVDTNGIGQGTGDRLRENNHEVLSFIGQEKADTMDSHGEYSFVNTRSAAWWNLREMLHPDSGVPIALPDDEFLISDLTAPRHVVRTGARIAVEEKKEIRKRLGRSPDTGDAVVMAFWLSGLRGGEAFNVSYGAKSEFVALYNDSRTNEYTAGGSVFDDVLAGYTSGAW